MFVVYMILVTLLLVNMLIAMMGNTYHMVNEAQGEWLRQVRSLATRATRGIYMREVYYFTSVDTYNDCTHLRARAVMLMVLSVFFLTV